jgi:hypothetical protein
MLIRQLGFLPNFPVFPGAFELSQFSVNEWQLIKIVDKKINLLYKRKRSPDERKAERGWERPT